MPERRAKNEPTIRPPFPQSREKLVAALSNRPPSEKNILSHWLARQIVVWLAAELGLPNRELAGEFDDAYLSAARALKEFWVLII
jgi:hypothetical protein